MEHAGKDDEAAALYSRSLDIRQGLSDSDPKDVLALSKTGYVKMRLALVEIELGHVERARELAQSSVAIQEEVVHKTKEQTALMSAALFTLGVAQEALAPGTSCELFARALKGFKAASPSTYLDQMQQRAERADQACHWGTSQRWPDYRAFDRERHAVATAKTQ